MADNLIKSAEEIEKMRIAGRLAAEVLEMITPHVQVGITTEELDRICHDHIINQQQGIPACLNYTAGGTHPPFPGSVCTSLNHVICHGIPSPRKLKQGDILNIDVTVIKDGYHGDTSKMFQVGKTSIMAQRLARVTYEAMWEAIKIVKPGTTIGDLGHATSQHAKKNRFSVVKEFCGHGIGSKFHEPPAVPFYGQPGDGMTLCEGMTFTIEPMLNAGKAGSKTLPDRWTAVTKDHSLSAQWEHTILVTSTGYEVLTLREEEKTA
ncbi:MAG: type I methionyl aminopeptidase [Gammaproteobacteria bacterium]|nr:type I methionyl aminopeptidase [Gammaproteobacteria bacterium]